MPRGGVVAVTYTVRAKRWDGGWELHIDGVGVTQALSLAGAERMVRDYLRLDDHQDHRTAVLAFEYEGIDGPLRSFHMARESSAAAEVAVREAGKAARRAVRELVQVVGLSGQEAAKVLGISPQRVSQLLAGGGAAKAKAAAAKKVPRTQVASIKARKATAQGRTVAAKAASGSHSRTKA